MVNYRLSALGFIISSIVLFAVMIKTRLNWYGFCFRSLGFKRGTRAETNIACLGLGVGF